MKPWVTHLCAALHPSSAQPQSHWPVCFSLNLTDCFCLQLCLGCTTPTKSTTAPGWQLPSLPHPFTSSSLSPSQWPCPWVSSFLPSPLPPFLSFSLLPFLPSSFLSFLKSVSSYSMLPGSFSALWFLVALSIFYCTKCSALLIYMCVSIRMPENSTGFLGAEVTGVCRMPVFYMGTRVQQGLVTAESSLKFPQSLS